MSRLGLFGAELALIVAGCALAKLLFPGARGLPRTLIWVAGTLGLSFPLFLWGWFHPPTIAVTATRETITYEFRDSEYAREFARLNGVPGPESVGEELMASLRKEFPFEMYVEAFGPLHWDAWVRALHYSPKDQAGLKALIEEADPEGRTFPKKPVFDRIVSFVRGRTDLNRRVETEYRIQLAHMLRHVLFGRDLPDAAAKPKEWKILYKRLKEILARHGTTDADGEPTYHLVGDEVEEPGHKIELTHPEMLTREFLGELQSILRGWKNAWYVILQLEFSEVNPDALPGMLVVWADHIDEAWDQDNLRSALGPLFKL